MNSRRYELDWLRVLAILVVFLYHSTRFFNLGDWHVKNNSLYVWVEMWNVYVTRWMMPLFFTISGGSLFYTIGKSRGFRRFYIDKFLRLMVPVIVAAITHSSLQIYLEKVTHGQFSGSYFAFLPEYFTSIYIDYGMPGNFAFHGTHLWYLLFLFVYGLICYLLFAWFKGRGLAFLNWLTGLVATPGLIYLWFSVPLLILKAVVPQPVMEVGAGGWGFLNYIWFLIAGFMIISSEQLQQQIKNQRWVSLISGVVLTVVFLFQLFSPSHVAFPAGINDWINAVLSFVSAWCWLFAILGFSMQLLAFDHPILGPANEGVMPFYILHQTVLLGLGFFIMTWEIHDALKWGIVFCSAFIVILALYLLLIKRVDLLRFLFGMKTIRPLFNDFWKKGVVIILHVLYISLIVFAAFGSGRSRAPMPMTYNPEKDIILNGRSITDQSSEGVRVVDDEETSMGKVMEFTSGANPKPELQPTVFIEMCFTAPAGRYTVWVRGKSDIDSDRTDSFWMEIDDQIGTGKGSARMGNWLDIHPVGIYTWAGDTNHAVTIQLKHTGDHKIRIQPRQTPHKIDQIWLSGSQSRIPDTFEPIK
jgi:peptidoglycan/LPS O-acetylase OafA/YrhL